MQISHYSHMPKSVCIIMCKTRRTRGRKKHITLFMHKCISLSLFMWCSHMWFYTHATQKKKKPEEKETWKNDEQNEYEMSIRVQHRSSCTNTSTRRPYILQHVLYTPKTPLKCVTYCLRARVCGYVLHEVLFVLCDARVSFCVLEDLCA